MSWFAADSPLFPEIIALHGKWQGAKPAVVDGDRALSWREFDLGTNRVANGLRSLGLDARRSRRGADAQQPRDARGHLGRTQGGRRRGAAQSLHHRRGGGRDARGLRRRGSDRVRRAMPASRDAPVAASRAAQRWLHRLRRAGCRGRLARVPRLARFAVAGPAGRRARRRRRVQHHLQLRNDRPAQGHRAHAPPAPRLGVRPRDRAALSLRRAHALLARPLLEHQLGRLSLHAARRRHGRRDARVRAAGAARDRRARADHARRDGAAAVPAHPRTAGLRSLRRRARCAA